MDDRIWLTVLFVVSRIWKILFPLSPFAPENLVSQDRFGISVHRRPAFSPSRFPRRCPHIHTVNRHRGSSDLIRPRNRAYRWRLLPLVRRQRASSPQANSSKEFFQVYQPINVRLPFPTSTIGTHVRCRKWYVSEEVNNIDEDNKNSTRTAIPESPPVSFD